MHVWNAVATESRHSNNFNFCLQTCL